MQGLTDRQQQVLHYIRQSITERGYPPTLREIGAHMGIRSTNGVNDHLRALERKGYLTREDMKSRALRPTPLGVGPLGTIGAAGTLGVLEGRAETRSEGFRFDSASDATFSSDIAFVEGASPK